ncbi:MAG: VCBS repeat-containing protein [Acidobacteriota bacterium]|nr:MAG: VCBS repeat-containing protein [Acidobacteriota bacterium]
MKRIIIAACLILAALLFVLFLRIKAGRWHESDGFRWAKLPSPGDAGPGFTRLPSAQTGITFVNRVTDEQAASNELLINGSGVAAGDIDGDGRCDLYFCRTDGDNALYRNLGGWRFEDITASAGVTCPERFSTGAVFADVDGDGDMDLLTTALGGPNACFRNDGKGKFREVTEEAGLQSNLGSTTMALADVDGDGDLDLYVARYSRQRAQTLVTLLSIKAGQWVMPDEFRKRFTNVAGRIVEYGEPDALYLNRGNGQFYNPDVVEVKTFLDEDGRPLSSLPLDWGLAAQFRDIDDDGDPDLYVCGDFWTPDRIWMNDGAGRFRPIGKLALRKTTFFTMVVDFADVDRDGDLDFFLTDMLSREHQLRKMQMGSMSAAPPIPLVIGAIDDRPQVMQNAMFVNRGDGTYAEVGQLSDVHSSEWSWSIAFLDVDLDGWEDILVGNGHLHDVQDSDTHEYMRTLQNFPYEEVRRTYLLMFPRLETPNIAFRNRGDLTFEEVGRQWGFDSHDISHGMALADLDGDGDLDVVVNHLRAEAGIYRNNAPAPRVAVRLKGDSPNTLGIGAKIRLLGGAVAEQSHEVICGGMYLSGSEPLRVFAAGDAQEMTLEVWWRSGKRSVVEGVRANRLYEIEESGAEEWQRPQPEEIEPWFEDASGRLGHVHAEEEFDDFTRQSLLPNRMSQLGPGVGWTDVDGDGNEDLLIASGRGGKLAIYRNDGRGGFEILAWEKTTQRDQTTVLGWARPVGGAAVLVGLSSFEDGRSDRESVARYDFGSTRAIAGAGLEGYGSSVGPMAMADVDGDGDLDLFVGGRTIPGRYPESASSRLFRNEGGRFVPDEENTKVLRNVGMVSGSVFSDIDGDGDADLVLAVEWGPVKVFLNEGGNYQDATEELGLSSYTGWWNGVTAGDFDNDGRMDIVATNWGRNTKYEHHYDEEHPLRIYYADFDQNGSLDVVEAHYDKAMGVEVPERGYSCTKRCMSFVEEEMGSYKAFGGASIEELYGERLRGAGVVEATVLDTMVFMNRGERFEGKALPLEAQLAPGFGVSVADMDGDGAEDVFMSQNFFATQVETPRMDGGRGLWLRGDGRGELTPVPGQESGVRVYGEQRGCAVGDFDRDGRVDLVVTQNGAGTKLYRNVRAKPGLRVRLRGGGKNPTGVGAVMRLEYEGGERGPAREVHAGSGYWSQDGAVQVLGQAREPRGIWVRWPGGKEVTAAVPSGAKEISMDVEEGRLEVLR